MRHSGFTNPSRDGASACPSALAKRDRHPRSDNHEGCGMSTGVAASPIGKSWRKLYKAALFEADKNRMSERIAHAEWALALRARELFHAGGGHLQERQEVDAAMQVLHALRSTT